MMSETISLYVVEFYNTASSKWLPVLMNNAGPVVVSSLDEARKWADNWKNNYAMTLMKTRIVKIANCEVVEEG